MHCMLFKGFCVSWGHLKCNWLSQKSSSFASLFHIYVYFFSSFFSEISIDHCFKGKTIEVIWKYSFSYKSGISTCIFWSKFYSVFPELVPPPLVEAAVPSPGLTHNHSVRWGSWGPGQASHVPRGTVVAETGGLRTWDSLLRGTHLQEGTVRLNVHNSLC